MGYFDDLAKQRAAATAQATTLKTVGRRLAGQPVTVERLNGGPLQGQLVHMNTSSAWLVVGGRDEMVPFGEIVDIHPPSGATAS